MVNEVITHIISFTKSATKFLLMVMITFQTQKFLNSHKIDHKDYKSTKFYSPGNFSSTVQCSLIGLNLFIMVKEL